MLFDPFDPYQASSLTFSFATGGWELDSYFQLRAAVFCEEQKLFTGSDLDDMDNSARHIISMAGCMGMADHVAGTVRINELSPGVWFGSRLAVRQDYRTLRRFQSQQLFNDGQALRPFSLSVGAGLIYKAVSSAMAMGCHRFRAHVQHQNLVFFERLYWKKVRAVTLHGYPHYLVEADLTHYPASRFIGGELRLTA